MCRYNCPDPVCGGGDQGLDLGAFASGPAPAQYPGAGGATQRVFAVDNR